MVFTLVISTFSRVKDSRVLDVHLEETSSLKVYLRGISPDLHILSFFSDGNPTGPLSTFHFWNSKDKSYFTVLRLFSLRLVL